MQKLNDLRVFLLSAVHDLTAHPDKLQIWLDEGAIDAVLDTDRLSYKYRYTAKILVTEYAGSPNDLIIPILFFLKKYQSDAGKTGTLKFEAEILNHDIADVLIEIQLTERVVTDVDDDTGNIETVVCEERPAWFEEPQGSYKLYDTDGKEVAAWQS